MRTTCYCTASSYDLLAFYQSLPKEGKALLFRDVVQIHIRHDKKARGDVFYFDFGVMISWGLSIEEENHYLQLVKPFERIPLGRNEIDELTYDYGDSMRIDEDEIILQNKNHLTKLAVSYGIAQSIKLTIFEEKISRSIEQTKRLPKELSLKGKISLSRKAISKKMGDLYIERSYINLNTEILDTPEFFWDHPEVEPYYRRTTHYLEVGKRADLLNKRMDVLHELYEILRNELNHQHSSRLEWTIIILIVIEVVIALLKDIFHVI